MAGKRLSADTFSLGKSGSSMNKGESLKDTALTLEAMNPDVIVIRHRSSGAAQFWRKGSAVPLSTPGTAGTPTPPRRFWTSSPCAATGTANSPGKAC